MVLHHDISYDGKILPNLAVIGQKLCGLQNAKRILMLLDSNGINSVFSEVSISSN